MTEKEEIENPWCVYGALGEILGFGEIVEDNKTTVDIKVRESPRDNKLWDPKFVKRFNKLEEAINYYIKNRPPVDIRCRDYTDNEIRELAKERFPSYFKN